MCQYICNNRCTSLALIKPRMFLHRESKLDHFCFFFTHIISIRMTIISTNEWVRFCCKFSRMAFQTFHADAALLVFQRVHARVGCCSRDSILCRAIRTYLYGVLLVLFHSLDYDTDMNVIVIFNKCIGNSMYVPNTGGYTHVSRDRQSYLLVSMYAAIRKILHNKQYWTLANCSKDCLKTCFFFSFRRWNRH